MSTQKGWEGRYYEDFTVGDRYQHSCGRTVTETDNIWSSCITHNTNQIHFNSDYSSKSLYKRPLMNSCLTFAILEGMSVSDTSLNGEVLEWSHVRMPYPLFNGNTIYSESEVVEKMEAEPDADFGVVIVKTRGITSEGNVIMEFHKKIKVFKKERAPKIQTFPQVQKTQLN